MADDNSRPAALHSAEQPPLVTYATMKAGDGVCVGEDIMED
jgi:hypothetical protein